MHVEAKVLKWGNSLGIRLSGTLKEAGFSPNTKVDVEIKKNGLFIKKIVPEKLLPFSEDQLLNGLDEKYSNELLAQPIESELNDCISTQSK